MPLGNPNPEAREEAGLVKSKVGSEWGMLKAVPLPSSLPPRATPPRGGAP